MLNTHRGYDAGALRLAQTLAKAYCAPLVASTVSRLLVDLNRSVGHPQLYSAATRSAPANIRAQILRDHYHPYRNKVEGIVSRAVSRGRRVIHLSAHSFTPALHGVVRNADVGLLYDPARCGEVALCARWKAALAVCAPTLRVRRNYPYAGKGDGLTSWLRRRFTPNAYVGVEIEMNQQMARRNFRSVGTFHRLLVESLRTARSPARGRQQISTIGGK